MYDFLIDIFKESPLLKKLSDEIIAQSFEDGSILLNKYKENEIVHLEGETCNSIEIVLEGMLFIDNIDIEGDILRIAELKKGDLIAGNIIFLENPKYPMTITTITEVTLAEIEKEKLLNLLGENKLFLSEFLRLMASNTMILSNKIKDKDKSTLRQKIMTYLKYEEARQNKKDILLPYSKKDLANKFDVQRTSLSRELKKMENDNLIVLNKRAILILF